MYAGIVVLFVSFSWLKVLLLKMVSKADSIVWLWTWFIEFKDINDI